jgi:hypothetical protein
MVLENAPDGFCGDVFDHATRFQLLGKLLTVPKGKGSPQTIWHLACQLDQV